MNKFFKKTHTVTTKMFLLMGFLLLLSVVFIILYLSTQNKYNIANKTIKFKQETINNLETKLTAITEEDNTCQNTLSKYADAASSIGDIYDDFIGSIQYVTDLKDCKSRSSSAMQKIFTIGSGVLN